MNRNEIIKALQDRLQSEKKERLQRMGSGSPRISNRAVLAASSQDHAESLCTRKCTSIENYFVGRQIGQGAYATVRLGVNKSTEERVAMKIYDKYNLLDVQRKKAVRREIKLLERMDHANVIRLHEAFETNKLVYLVMQHVAGGSLYAYLKTKPMRRMEESEARSLFR